MDHNLHMMLWLTSGFLWAKSGKNACPDGHVPCVSRIERALWYVGTNIPLQERLSYCKIIGKREPYPAPRNYNWTTNPASRKAQLLQNNNRWKRTISRPKKLQLDKNPASRKALYQQNNTEEPDQWLNDHIPPQEIYNWTKIPHRGSWVLCMTCIFPGSKVKVTHNL
jgi:hypothetical protein